MDNAQAEYLFNTLVWLTAHPDKHNQGVYIKVNQVVFDTRAEAEAAWNCGTAACLAGHAVIYDGWRPRVVEHLPCFADEKPSFWLSDVFVTKGDDEQMYSVDEVANQLFGLNDEEGEYLYDERNTIDDLWRIAEELSDGRINATEHSFTTAPEYASNKII